VNVKRLVASALVSFGALLLGGCSVPASETEGGEAANDTNAEGLVAATPGLDTCGPSHNERCDAKVPVKISDKEAILLGKYDITAGRYRAFVNAVNSDVHGYIQSSTPAWWNGVWRTALSSASPTGVGNRWADVGGYGYDWTAWLPSAPGDVGYLLGP
jgi:hypothetical protein